jgi:hypothetical protein
MPKQYPFYTPDNLYSFVAEEAQIPQKRKVYSRRLVDGVKTVFMWLADKPQYFYFSWQGLILRAPLDVLQGKSKTMTQTTGAMVWLSFQQEKGFTGSRLQPQSITMTNDQYTAIGRELFGDDPQRWYFVCPSCGGVQCGEDFAPFVARGDGFSAQVKEARRTCIGWYTHPNNLPFTGAKPCSYAPLYNVNATNINPVVIPYNGQIYNVFAYAGWNPDEKTEPS